MKIVRRKDGGQMEWKTKEKRLKTDNSVTKTWIRWYINYAQKVMKLNFGP